MKFDKNALVLKSPPYSGARALSIRGYPLPPEYFQTIICADGFVMDDNLFRFFGIEANLGFGTIFDQNYAPWVADYGPLCNGLVFFAEDIFGDRYAFTYHENQKTTAVIGQVFLRGRGSRNYAFSTPFGFPQ